MTGRESGQSNGFNDPHARLCSELENPVEPGQRPEFENVSQERHHIEKSVNGQAMLGNIPTSFEEPENERKREADKYPEPGRTTPLSDGDDCAGNKGKLDIEVFIEIGEARKNRGEKADGEDKSQGENKNGVAQGSPDASHQLILPLQQLCQSLKNFGQATRVFSGAYQMEKNGRKNLIVERQRLAESVTLGDFALDFFDDKTELAVFRLLSDHFQGSNEWNTTGDHGRELIAENRNLVSPVADHHLRRRGLHEIIGADHSENEFRNRTDRVHHPIINRPGQYTYL